MKGFILTQNKTAYKTAYTLKFKTLYTPAKLLIPKKDGKPNLNAVWYVYYRYRNPKTGILQKFEIKQGINRLKTIAERKQAGNNLKKAINRLLQEGYNPFEQKKEEENIFIQQKITTLDAFKKAYSEKQKNWKESTINANKTMFNVFIKWLKTNNLEKLDIQNLEKKHISLFLNELTNKDGRSLGNTSRNNYKRLISSLVTQLVTDDILKYNFTYNIPLVKNQC